MPSNRAAWLLKPGQPLEVKEAPYTPAQENDVVVKNHAVALNPVDALGISHFNWVAYPTILGGDVAGEVVEVGSAVSRFQVGDRVVGFAAGLGANNNPRCGFQEYSVLYANNVARIPGSMAYERAVVVPLTLTTAVVGLFHPDFLGLPLPSLHAVPAGKTVLVWGGATSVGCNAIQLAVGAGYEVITTCSPGNYGMVKRLGASQAFDYKDKDVVSRLVKAFEGKTSAGIVSIAGVTPESRQVAADACYEVAAGTQGSKFVALAGPAPGPMPEGISSKFIYETAFDTLEALKVVFNEYLPGALAKGKFVPAPEPSIVGHGLESFQGALEIMARGVSASKVVVTL